MRLVRISPPLHAALSVGIDEVREQLRIDEVEAQSGLIVNAIRAAEAQAEEALNRKLLAQTWEVWLPAWRREIRLDTLGNLQEVEMVKCLSPDGMEEILPESEIVAVKTLPAEVHLTGGQRPLANRPDALRVRVSVGYGDTAEKIPACIRQWILYQVVGLYEQRSPLVMGGNSALDGRFVDGLLDPERIPCL